MTNDHKRLRREVTEYLEGLGFRDRGNYYLKHLPGDNRFLEVEVHFRGSYAKVTVDRIGGRYGDDPDADAWTRTNLKPFMDRVTAFRATRNKRAHLVRPFTYASHAAASYAKTDCLTDELQDLLRTWVPWELARQEASNV